MAFACGTCWKSWTTWQSRNQHVVAKSHTVPDFECDSCDRYFGNQQAVNQHMTALGHWAESASSSSGELEHYCDYGACTEVFGDENALRSHETHEHLYCSPCDRAFQDENSINMVRPRTHVSLKTNVYSIAIASCIVAGTCVAISVTIHT